MRRKFEWITLVLSATYAEVKTDKKYNIVCSKHIVHNMV